MLLCRARKVWDVRYQRGPPSSSRAPILRALWVPRALGAEPAGCLACERRGPKSHPELFLHSLRDAAPHPAWERRPLLFAAPRTPCLCLAWPGLAWLLCQERGEWRTPPLCLSSLCRVPPAGLGTEALPEHPSLGPGSP